MNFTLSTKPFADSLNLGVINANISKFNQKSYLAELTATRNTLTVNLEAAQIVSEIKLKGSGDSDEQVTAFVDCGVLKSIVNTFEASVTTIEFTEGGIILHSGKSKFTLPKMIESAEGSLARLSEIPAGAATVKVNKADWKFIDDYQMYAIAMSFVYPVYTHVWMGKDGDTIVGDFTNSLFTYSKTGKLGKTCLLTDTIVNLMNSLPENAEISTLEDGYRIDVKTDGFEYAAEFYPMYEDDKNDYKSEIMLQQVMKNENDMFNLPVAEVKKFVAQSDILSSGSDEFVDVALAAGELRVSDANVDCRVAVQGTATDFQIQLKSEHFKAVLNHLDSETVSISPIKDEGSVLGLVFWTDNLAVVLGGAE